MTAKTDNCVSPLTLNKILFRQLPFRKADNSVEQRTWNILERPWSILEFLEQGMVGFVTFTLLVFR